MHIKQMFTADGFLSPRRAMRCGLLLTSAALAIGCAAAPGAAPPPPNPTFERSSEGVAYRVGPIDPGARLQLAVSPDSVWLAVMDVYSAFGLTADVIDTRARRYGVQRFSQTRLGGKRTSEYVRCGFEATGPAAVIGYRTELSIISVVIPAAHDSTTVSTEVSGTAMRADGSTGPMQCASTGELEQRINALVRDRLAG